MSLIYEDWDSSIVPSSRTLANSEKLLHNEIESNNLTSISDSDLEVPDSEVVDHAITDVSVLSFPKLKHHKIFKKHHKRLNSKLNSLVSSHPYYIHAMIYRCELKMLRELINCKPLNLPEIINFQDHHENTPLMLAIKLAQSKRDFIDIIRLLLRSGADPHIKDHNGWSVMDEAVAQKNSEIVGILFEYFHEEKMKKWEINRHLALEALESLPDFYLEIKWEFDSKVIPLIGHFTPNDTCKLWKVGKSFRLDTTLVGWKKLKSKRRNMSFFFKNNALGDKRNSVTDLIVANHSKKTLVNPLEDIDPEEKLAVIGDILKSEPIQGDLSFISYTVEPCLSWRGKPVKTKISQWNSQKFKVDFKALFKYKKKGVEQVPLSENRYFEILGTDFSESSNFEHHLPQAEAKCDINKNLVKNSKAHMWISEEFPFSLNKFLPILKLLSTSSSTMMKLYKFLSSENLTNIVPINSFPIKLDIPITMSIRAVVTFTKFQLLPSGSENFAEIPNYSIQSRKVAQKTLTCPKKRLFLANLVV
ncbi:unnamed protein product [Blepharisma stoltei]|uniref:Ankyrin repeat domain-containing protein n=1 Tax=Blepharisma stoltei TaxID=1481888 RepID=A0AAU9IA47_9CILI|nr:unnamed protein product [Blepharisma stoltei]